MTDTEKAALERRIYDRCIVRVGQLEAEKATLEERIDELCAEAERLRQENAKLREMLSSYWKAVHCPVTPTVPRDYLTEMRELGIEVGA